MPVGCNIGAVIVAVIPVTRRSQQADEVVFKGIALGDAFPEWEVSC